MLTVGNEEVQMQPLFGVDVHGIAACRLNHLSVRVPSRSIVRAGTHEVEAGKVLPLLCNAVDLFINGGQCSSQLFSTVLDVHTICLCLIHRVTALDFTDTDGQQQQCLERCQETAHAGSALKLGNTAVDDLLADLAQRSGLARGDTQRQCAQLIHPHDGFFNTRDLARVADSDDQRVIGSTTAALCRVETCHVDGGQHLNRHLGQLLKCLLDGHCRSHRVAASSDDDMLEREDFLKRQRLTDARLHQVVLLGDEFRDAVYLTSHCIIEFLFHNNCSPHFL